MQVFLSVFLPVTMSDPELQDLLINQKELSDQLSVDNLLVELQKRGSSGTWSNGEVDEERQWQKRKKKMEAKIKQ